MTTRLAVQHLRVTYGTGQNRFAAVDDVSFVIEPGQTLGLVGESGCGKSTVARALVGLVPLSGGGVALDGEDVTSDRARNSRDFRRRVQLVFQDPYSSLNPRMTVEDLIAEALMVRGDSFQKAALRDRETRRLLGLVGLGEASLRRFPQQFSGGQRQRIAIARALAVGSQTLITDEVTSALDVSVQATILSLLKDLQRELGLSYLFISHDLSAVRLMAHTIAVMYLGQIVELATNEQIFAAPTHPYTQVLMLSVPSLDHPRQPVLLEGDVPDPRRPPPGCRFHTRCPIGPNRYPGRTICKELNPHESPAFLETNAACHFAPRADVLAGLQTRSTIAEAESI